MSSQEQILTHFAEQPSLAPKAIYGLFKKISYDINFSILTELLPTNIVLKGKKPGTILGGNKATSALFVHGCAAIPKPYYNLIYECLNIS